MWFVLNMGPEGIVEDVSNSFAAMIGRFLVPVLKPAGLGSWQIAVATRNTQPKEHAFQKTSEQIGHK